MKKAGSQKHATQDDWNLPKQNRDKDVVILLTVTAVVTHHPMELATRRVDRPIFVQDCDELEFVLLASLEIVSVAAIGQPPGGQGQLRNAQQQRLKLLKHWVSDGHEPAG